MNDDLFQDVEDSPLEPIQILNEAGRWRARDVTYLAGAWHQLKPRIPTFELRAFSAGPDEPPNPNLKAVVRLPLTAAERPIPVATVSHRYTLASHGSIIEECLAALKARGINPNILRCELGLSTLGEWMNFRAYFPDEYSFIPADGHKLALRLECFNSVDGSSRLIVLFGWLRFICSNGMIVGETMSVLRNIHDETLDLTAIPKLVSSGMQKVERDRRRLKSWSDTPVTGEQVARWADEALAERWGKKAACRAFHICAEGTDVELSDPFEPVQPTLAQTKPTTPVPGALAPVTSLYGVSQALVWLAGRRNNVEERVLWQAQVPTLLKDLTRYAAPGAKSRPAATHAAEDPGLMLQ